MEITTPQGTLTGDSIESILSKYGRDCLQGADLHTVDLRGADLSFTDLRGADLTGADLTGANLTGSNGVSRPHATTEAPAANSGVNETGKPDDMTPAELKTLRESMGLTIKWLAARWHTAECSVIRWERNRRLPDTLAQDMQTLRREYRKAITEGIAANEPTIIVPRTDATTHDDKPAAWHRSVAQRIREATGCKLVYSPETTTPTDQDKD